MLLGRYYGIRTAEGTRSEASAALRRNQQIQQKEDLETFNR